MKTLSPLFGLKRLLPAAFMLLCSLAASAQLVSPIDGDLTPNPGNIGYEYTTIPDIIFFTNPTATLTPSNVGQVLSVELLPDGYTLRVYIKWFLPGAVTIKVFYHPTLVAQQNLTVTCDTIPATPTLSIYTPICGTSGAAVLDAAPGAGGDNIKWYTAATGGTALTTTGNTYITPTISSATTYYASSTNSLGHCESTSRASVAVPINAALSVPTAQVDGQRCTPGSVTISATPASPATSIRWYTSSIGGELIATGTSYSPELTKQGDLYYYASSYNSATGCSSAERLAVKASVSPVPSEIFASFSTSPYGSGTAEITAVQLLGFKERYDHVLPDTTDFQVRWFADEAKANANTPVLAKGVTYTTPLLTASTTYYMRLQNKVTSCLGPVAPAMAYVRPVISKQSIKTEVVRVPGKTLDSDLYILPPSQKSVTITYLDGLGRAIQQVAVKASADGKDLIQPVEYDALGRVTKQYLAYSDTTTLGLFHSAYQAEQYNFYQQTGSKVANDTYPFSKSVYEDSPLGRLIEQTKAGQAFQPGSGHTGSMVYGFNSGSTSSEAEEVRKFNPDGTSSGFYAANILSRTEGINPDGIHTITFADPAGRTIVTKQQLDETVEGVSVSYLETYYIYDDFGQVKFMIQPKGVAALKANSWTLTSAIKKQYVFQYMYDKRGRVTETRVPGKGWSYTVYNQLNQPVLVQDTLLKGTNQWMFMKYDRSGRVVMTGLYTDNTNTTRTYFQTLLDNKNYSTEKAFETRSSSGTHKYTNVAFPTSGTEVLSVNYYDTYDFDSYATYTAQSISGEGTQGSAIGKPTGSKTLVHGTADWLKKFVYYDNNGRPIQVRSNNHLNLTPDNLSTTVYDFEKVLKTKTYHNAGTPGNTTVLNTYEYYDQGRLKGIKQSNNGSADQLVVKYEYNTLGQVVDKKLHETGTAGSGTFLQSVDYRYTINGQLASINNATLDASSAANDETNDYFGMELLYNTTESGLTTTQRYDGMISALKWKSVGSGSGDAGQRSYAYAYDKSGKLETASYAVKESSWNQETGAQDESITYDRNGNIKSLTRNQRKHQLTGITGSYTNETIDNLTYTYKTADANSLEKVTDAAGTAAAVGFDNGTSSTGNDYTYDVNGNLKSDLNKGISSIVYNFLGKPTQVNFTDGKKIEYVYDAGGNKLTQKLYQGATLQTTTHYANGFVYEAVTTGSPALSFFGSPEGRVVKNGGNLEYEYSIADHQGNTRVVFTSATPSDNTITVNFESASNSNVENYTRTNFELFDHTDVSGSTYSYSQKLTGASGSQIGVAKTLKVYPGDKVKIDAYAKYYNPSGTASNISGFALALTGAFGVTSASTGEALKAYNTLNNYGGIIAGGGSGGNDDHPKLFMNILLFDKDYNFLDAAWEQIDGGEQVGATPKAAHDLMSKEVTVKEAGYAYVFISNENPTLVEFYVDDVVITHTPTNVIQYNEYYPFGLQTSTSWTRESTKDNQFLYNASSELNKTSGWYEMYYRGYDPAIGRMLQVDPYAPLYPSTTTYNYAMNNPIIMNDPNGGQVDATGLTNSQLRSLYLANRWQSNSGDFADWASDNVTGTSLDRSYFGSAAGGRWASFEYRYFYADGVEAEWKRHVEKEWVPDNNSGVDEINCDCPPGSDCYEEYDDNGNLVRKEIKKRGSGEDAFEKVSVLTAKIIKASAKETAMLYVGGMAFKLLWRGGKWVYQAYKISKSAAQTAQVAEYTLTQTVANSLATRPYLNSPLVVQEIMATGSGAADASFKGGMNWVVEGTFNGSKGVFELGVNPETKVIYHFLFKSL